MHARARHFAWLTALSLAACGGATPSDEHDASMSRDMSTTSQDSSLEDGATPSDGALVDAELPADMSRDSSADAASSGCTSDEMCADPIRERCNTSTGACEGRPQWAITTIQYEDGEERTLSDIFAADATLFLPEGYARVGFQQGGGWFNWTLALPAGTEEGIYPIERLTNSRVWISAAETSIMMPERQRGYWQSTGGTLTLLSANLAVGGRVSGSLVADIQKTDDESVTGTMSVYFYAEFNP